MYIPKNRIKTNLYTSGDEFTIKGTEQIYSGFYHILYTGKYFTGKTQNELPISELVPISPQSVLDLPPSLETTMNKIALFLNDPDPIVREDQWNQGDIVTYLQLKDQSTTDDRPRKMPYQFFPKPTEDDYNLGAFTRYFCVKINENIYFEISKDTYDALNKKNANWMWQLFIPFQFLWTISGEEKEIEKTNYNMTLIQERRLKRRGLTQFLRNNYLKFYPSPYTTEDVISPPIEIPVEENKNSLKDLFKIINEGDPRLMITPEEIENAKIATPTVTSSIGNPLTGIEAVFNPNQREKKGSNTNKSLPTITQQSQPQLTGSIETTFNPNQNNQNNRNYS